MTTIVYHDGHRHTCVAERSSGMVSFVRMTMIDAVLETSSEKTFDKEFTAIDDYPAARAARLYLDSFKTSKIPVSLEARALLERIAGPAFKRELLSEPAPTPPSTTSKEDTMATAKKKPVPAKKATAPEKAAPAAKKAATPAAKKVAPAPADESPKRGRAPSIDGSAKIKLLISGNPKRSDAHRRFAFYKNGMTVDEYIAAGGTRADVNWDVKQQLISVK